VFFKWFVKIKIRNTLIITHNLPKYWLFMDQHAYQPIIFSG